MPEQRSFGIKGVCLRAQMKREVRCNTFCNSDNGRVVDDECIRACCIKCCNRFGQIFQIFITHKRIHGDVNLHTAFVRISNGLRNLFKRKIIRKVAQRERGCSEIHGVRAELNCGHETFPVARRGKEFNFSLFISHISPVVQFVEV